MGRHMNPGIGFALLAFGSWGLIPLYWSFFHEISPFETICHRIFWSWLFYSAWLLLKPENSRRLSNKERLALFAASLLLGGNWWIYIYAVNSGQVTESSLGYFINPLLNFSLGVFFLRERLSIPKKIAVFSAVVGVAYLTWLNHGVPWIAICLSLTFGTYGLIKKKISVSSLQSGQFETIALLPVALLVLAKIFVDHKTEVASRSWETWALLISTGPVTGMPLLWFASAARSMKLSTLGFFQYIAPTMQFLLAMFYFKEAFDFHKAIGYSFVWFGLLIVIIESATHGLKNRRLHR